LTHFTSCSLALCWETAWSFRCGNSILDSAVREYVLDFLIFFLASKLTHFTSCSLALCWEIVWSFWMCELHTWQCCTWICLGFPFSSWCSSLLIGVF
jgi:hypothetical protein